VWNGRWRERLHVLNTEFCASKFLEQRLERFVICGIAQNVHHVLTETWQLLNENTKLKQISNRSRNEMSMQFNFQYFLWFCSVQTSIFFYYLCFRKKTSSFSHVGFQSKTHSRFFFVLLLQALLSLFFAPFW
jgi:hypothetical protein